MPDLFDFHEQWTRLVDRAYSGGYDQLSPEEKVWFNAQLLLQAIGDGGLISYYFNSSSDTLNDCLAALDDLGSGELKGLMIQVNGLFPGGVPADINDRNAIINSWPDDGAIDDFLDPIEAKASIEAALLEKRVVEYIEKHRLGA